MIADRALILAQGTEVELDVQPIDPRDPLRGEYVQLRYAISELDRDKLPPEAVTDWPTRERGYTTSPAWVVLERQVDGGPRVRSVHGHRPRAEPGTIVLAAKAECYGWRWSRDANTCSKLQMQYGIERFYVPEGEGKKIEDARREKRVTVVAAVAADGRTAIKRLLIDRKPFHDEPLF